MYNTTEGWISPYATLGALWIHDENPKRPHALLTSGNHSSGFFNSGLVTENPSYLDQAAWDLITMLGDAGLVFGQVPGRAVSPRRVVGPAMGAITLAHNIALNIACDYGGTRLTSFTEKESEVLRNTMVFKRNPPKPGEEVLVTEDVLTTAKSVKAVMAAVEAHGATILPFVAVLVNRSGLKEVCGAKIVALIDHPMPMWMPEECPLCKQGSEAIRPKEAGNWARLNGAY
jgi:orotate phosphoribosyltransferase